MKLTSLAFMLVSAVSTAGAFAADRPAPTSVARPQQQRMSDCAKDAHAKSLKGDAYKSFMSTCMKSTAPTTNIPNATTTPATAPANGSTDKYVAVPSEASNPQQQKMKTCATEAKTQNLKGNDRRAYMSTCLKGDAATATPAAK
jgi:psiF repeat